MGSLKRVSLASELSAEKLLLSHDPNPRDFERFVPWFLICQYDITSVVIKKCSKAEYQPVAIAAAKKPKKPLKNPSLSVPISQSLASTKEYESTKELSSSTRNLTKLAIISAYFDTNGVLVEIAFIDCLAPVPRELFMAIQLCLPYNPQLTRITWKGKRLTSILVHEIAKILPGSEITDVIIDGCYVREANYYHLLDKTSKLKYLSLTNCEINDEVCVMIAKRIQRYQPSAENLLVLNLSSNRITDVGAEALGRSLRTNRRLLYLNLCNNDITSFGAAHILSPLTKFQLSDDENGDIQVLKMKSFKNKLAGKDIKDPSKIYSELKPEKEQKSKLKKKIKSRAATEAQLSDTSVYSIDDIYFASVTEEKGTCYSSGNFTLCALNLAYNRLDWAAVSRLTDVVIYQYNADKCSKTGLLRVVIEGNPIPETCKEYDLINKYIDLAIRESTPLNPYMPTMQVNLVKSKTRMSRSEQILK